MVAHKLVFIAYQDKKEKEKKEAAEFGGRLDKQYRHHPSPKECLPVSTTCYNDALPPPSSSSTYQSLSLSLSVFNGHFNFSPIEKITF